MSMTRIGHGPPIGPPTPCNLSIPKTGTYTTFPSDKKNANVRQMLGRPGEAWGGESGTDRLVVIRD